VESALIEHDLITNTFTLAVDVVIRPARPDDLPKLEWFGKYWRFRNLFRQTYADQQTGRRLMLVADAGGFPVGQVFIQFDANEPRYADGRRRAYLYSLRVLEPFQGHGLGTRLIRAAEEVIAARGFDEVTIAVAKDNPNARRLYERLGYRVFAEDTGCWSFMDPDGQWQRVTEPCYVLEKHLDSAQRAADARRGEHVKR
jgi:ribosomal protein S18 acetylase RimI-like enzyme